MERAAFMRGNFGLMSHWLYQRVDAGAQPGTMQEKAEEWNARVEAFDVKRLASQLASTGARWFILTIGQNSGFYCAPNPVYDRLVGHPVSTCSRRDLFKDLALALQPHGIRLIAYLPSGAPDTDPQAMERLQWRDLALRDENGAYLRGPNGTRRYEVTPENRQAEFQWKWAEVIAQWARQWGPLCAGWWVDGAYYGDAMYNFAQEPNDHTLARALRAGNPQAALCFNTGICRTEKFSLLSEEEDYTAGELNSFLYAPFGTKHVPQEIVQAKVGHAQLHLLSFLGGNWGQGPAPRYPAELTCAWTNYIRSNGGAVTWDVPTTATGEIPEAFLSLLQKL